MCPPGLQSSAGRKRPPTSTYSLHHNCYQNRTTVKCTMMFLYVWSEQMVLAGLSSRSPDLSKLRMLMALIPVYGTLPNVNISQHVTPNAHCTYTNTHTHTHTVYTPLLVLLLGNHLTTSVFSLYLPPSMLSGAIHLMGTFSSLGNTPSFLWQK